VYKYVSRAIITVIASIEVRFVVIMVVYTREFVCANWTNDRVPMISCDLDMSTSEFHEIC